LCYGPIKIDETNRASALRVVYKCSRTSFLIKSRQDYDKSMVFSIHIDE